MGFIEKRSGGYRARSRSATTAAASTGAPPTAGYARSPRWAPESRATAGTRRWAVLLKRGNSETRLSHRDLDRLAKGRDVGRRSGEVIEVIGGSLGETVHDECGTTGKSEAPSLGKLADDSSDTLLQLG